jgi:prepilin-type N-terminal cleavage/methylation domain-containing protein
MKLACLISHAGRPSPARLAAAFTLTEILVAMAVFSLLVAGVVGSGVFGLSMYQISETKLTESAGARIAVSKMADEIRTCTTTYVGAFTNGSFAGVAGGEVQSGSALLLYPTTNTSNFIVFFFNPSDRTFRRTTSAPGTTTILADAVTNTVIFSAQDFQGNVLTNSQNNRVIHACLEFFQPQGTVPGSGSYKLETSATRRAL